MRVIKTHCARVIKTCVKPGCTRPGDYTRGLCSACAHQFWAKCRALKLKNNLRAERERVFEDFLHPEPPKWEFEGDEASLTAMQEAREKESAA